MPKEKTKVLTLSVNINVKMHSVKISSKRTGTEFSQKINLIPGLG